MTMTCQFLYRRAYLLVLLLLYGNELVGSARNSPAANDRKGQDAMATATEPFKREIERLKEQLEGMEARHDTLEAATEQFRIKTKAIKEKLETEKGHYDTLEAVKAAAEEGLRGDIDDLNERLQESEKRTASLQKSLETFNADKKGIDIQLEEAKARYDSLESSKVAVEQSLREETNKLNKLLQETESRASLLKKSLEIALADKKEHQEEARKRIEAANRLEERMRDVVAENKDFASMIKQRDDELAGAKSIYFELRQELFNTNERLREMETKAESTFVSRLQVVLDRVNHDVLPLLTEKTTKLLNFAKEQGGDALDQGTKMTNTLIEALDSRTTTFIRTVKETLYRPVTSGPFEELSRLYQKLHQSVTEIFQPFFASGTFEDVSKRYQKAHQDVVTCYHKVHRGAIGWLESTGTIISSYFILQEGPDTHSFLYTISLLVKAHSESIIMWAEILFVLLCIDFAITACLSSRSQPVKTKEVSNTSLLRCLSSRSQPVKTKEVSNTSLLRKATNLPRPPSA